MLKNIIKTFFSIFPFLFSVCYICRVVYLLLFLFHLLYCPDCPPSGHHLDWVLPSRPHNNNKIRFKFWFTSIGWMIVVVGIPDAVAQLVIRFRRRGWLCSSAGWWRKIPVDKLFGPRVVTFDGRQKRLAQRRQMVKIQRSRAVIGSFRVAAGCRTH